MKKKRIIKVTAFLLVFVILFAAVSRMFMTNSNNTRSIQGIYAEKENTLDVLMVGASSTKTNFASPLAYKNFGFTSYTLSYDGTAFEMLEPLLKEAMKTQSPKLVLIDLRAVLTPLTNQRARSVIDNMKWSDNKRETIEKYSSEDSKLSFYMTLDKYHTRWKDISSVLSYYYYMLTEPLRYDAFSQYSLKEIYIDKQHFLKGFFTSTLIGETEMCVTFDEVTEKDRISDSAEKAILDMMQYLKEENINGVFFLSPMCYSERFVYEQRLPQQLNYARDFVREHGFECIDLRNNKDAENMGFDHTTDFGDARHMNINGAVKFTNYFGKMISEKYNLPDHRGDETYDNEWNKAVNVMDNVLEYCKKKMKDKFIG